MISIMATENRSQGLISIDLLCLVIEFDKTKWEKNW